MRRLFRWVGIVLVSLVALLVVLYGVIYFRAQSIMDARHTAPAVAVAVPTDAASLARGERLVTILADCVGCHGPNLAGGAVIDDPAIGRIIAPNLTTGKNGFGSQLSDADIARVLRYGILPDGRSIRIMPADDYSHFTDADLGAVIAYVRSVPPVDTDHPATALGPLGRVLLVTGQLPIMIVDRIDLSDIGTPPIEPSVSAEYGHYLVKLSCAGCHGSGLSGGAIPGAPPDWPDAANLTPSGEVVGWSEADFIKTLRTGANPAGRQLAEQMPWQTFRNMTDDELKAIWAFIQTVPAKEAGTR